MLNYFVNTWWGCPGEMNSLMTRLTTSAAGKKSNKTLGKMSHKSPASSGPSRRTQSKRIDILSIACISSSGLVSIVASRSPSSGFMVYMQVRKSWRAGTTTTGLGSVSKSVAILTGKNNNHNFKWSLLMTCFFLLLMRKCLTISSKNFFYQFSFSFFINLIDSN